MINSARQGDPLLYRVTIKRTENIKYNDSNVFTKRGQKLESNS